jgi:hypothetical protein
MRGEGYDGGSMLRGGSSEVVEVVEVMGYWSIYIRQSPHKIYSLRYSLRPTLKKPRLGRNNNGILHRLVILGNLNDS